MKVVRLEKKMKKHKILLFAQLAQLVGKKELLLELESNTTAKEVIVKLIKIYPQIKTIEDSLIVAVDTEQIALEDKIGQVREEIAIFPPVSGG